MSDIKKHKSKRTSCRKFQFSFLNCILIFTAWKPWSAKIPWDYEWLVWGKPSDHRRKAAKHKRPSTWGQVNLSVEGSTLNTLNLLSHWPTNPRAEVKQVCCQCRSKQRHILTKRAALVNSKLVLPDGLHVKVRQSWAATSSLHLIQDYFLFVFHFLSD